MHHTKIVQKERELLSLWKKEGIANKEIARRLGRPVLTIRRGYDCQKICLFYNPT